MPTQRSDAQDLLSLCDCANCPLRGVRNPVLGAGGLESGVVIVGEAPGRNEAEQGVPFIGQSGKLLDATLEDVGIKRTEVYVTNAVLCRPIDQEGGDIHPTAAAIAACRPRLVEEVRRAKPKIVVTMGGISTVSLLQSRDSLGALVGSTHWSREVEAFIMPTFHPSTVLRGNEGMFDEIYDVLKRVGAMIQGRVGMPEKEVNIPFEYVDTPEKALEALLRLARDSDTIAIDCETQNLRYLEHRLLVVSMSSPSYNIVFDAPVLAGEDTAGLLFRAMLEDPRITWVLHNMAFDRQFFQYHYGVVPNTTIDTLTMALGVVERSNAVGLKRLARGYLGAPYYEREVDQYTRGKGTDMALVPWDILVKYAAYDTYYTLRLPKLLSPGVEAEGTWPLINNVLLPAQRLFANMRTVGVQVDVEWTKGLEALWLPKIEDATRRLQEYAESVGFDARKLSKAKNTSPLLNPSSSKQLIHLFYDILGYVPPSMTSRAKAGKRASKLGQRTTSGEFINQYEQDPPVGMLKEIRQLNKALRTYVYGILDDVWVDGRVHPDFRLYAAVTGRISITDPPLQTIPHWGIARLGVHATEEIAAQLRRIFVATPGYVMIEADYAQLELRVAWHYSKDEALGSAIMSGDFHSRTASAVLHKPLSEVTKSDRFISKFVTFGVMYGRQAPGLATGELNCSVQQAQWYIDQFWAAYPRYKRWWDGIRDFVVKHGYVKSSLGRKRRWNLITRDNSETIKNQAVNMPIQSLASDLCLLSAVQIDEQVRAKGWGRVLFLVHDSVVLEVEEKYLEVACRLVKEIMTRPTFPTCATFGVDIAAGPSWSELKEIEV